MYYILYILIISSNNQNLKNMFYNPKINLLPIVKKKKAWSSSEIEIIFMVKCPLLGWDGP